MERIERTRLIFVETIEEDYSNYCKARGKKETTAGFASYLVNRNVIEDKVINRFLTIALYPTALNEAKGMKTFAIYTLENILGLSNSYLRGVICRHLSHFRLKKRVKSEL